MLDPESQPSETAIGPKLSRVRTSTRREDQEIAPEEYPQVFQKFSIRSGLDFVDDQIALEFDLNRRLLDILHFVHAGPIKMAPKQRSFCGRRLTKT